MKLKAELVKPKEILRFGSHIAQQKNDFLDQIQGSAM